ncbi:MAG: B12-binding domain-containing protein [Candidatus Methanomethylophilaceae archaeon]|jgi:methanol corrinoid protein|nr:B12-binding domain-containing protein [Candidatus Methanomethylophilaceae archaeon]MBR4202635.1 B12-binding domain-containing protein [Candidatus Methanomethylophilaceae archaeon]MBR6910899.1 B12-binding domain-containing protein [Candidatus Methanomethylophilaceae archaeon]
MLSKEGADFTKVLKRYDIDMQVTLTPEEMAEKMLPTDPVFRKVADQVLHMQFKTVGPTVMEALKERDPLDIINNGLVAGMECVAKLYAEHVYFLPEIMMAAKTMEIGIAIAEKQVPGGRESKGTVVMHAAEGDPHDIGKNIAAVMVRSSGYDVIDMGRDVPIVDFVAKVEEVKPLFASGTALMTTTMSAFPTEAKMLMDKGINIPLMGCGGAVNREYANSYDLGIYSEKAPQTPLIAEKIREGYDWKRIREEWDSIVGGL